MNYIPVHPQTPCACAKALYLADLLCPLDERQAEAQQRIIEAVRSGNLYDTVEAVKAARASQITDRHHLAAQGWSEWAQDWLNRVDSLILQDLKGPSREEG